MTVSCTPFGLNTAPHVLTKVTAYAYLNDINLHVYLVPAFREESLSHIKWLIHLCTRLELVVNLENSDLEPSQTAIYLGIKLDTRLGLVYRSYKRVENGSISQGSL